MANEKKEKIFEAEEQGGLTFLLFLFSADITLFFLSFGIPFREQNFYLPATSYC